MTTYSDFPKKMDLASEVFVLRDDRMLALLRRGTPPLWYLPGGMVEADEQPIDAAARETLEETGLVVRPRLINVWRRHLASGVDRVHCTYVAAFEGGEVVLNEEHTDFAWMTPQEFLAHWQTYVDRDPRSAELFGGIRANVTLVEAELP